jgi:hypothetical protein
MYQPRGDKLSGALHRQHFANIAWLLNKAAAQSDIPVRATMPTTLSDSILVSIVSSRTRSTGGTTMSAYVIHIRFVLDMPQIIGRGSHAAKCPL